MEFDWRSSVGYEEGPVREGWVYKFDHAVRSNGQWHPFTAGSSSIYRIVEDYLQVVIPQQEAPKEFVDQVVSMLTGSGPILKRDSLEVSIGRKGSGYWIRDYRFETEAPKIEYLDDLNWEGFKNACVRLQAMP